MKKQKPIVIRFKSRLVRLFDSIFILTLIALLSSGNAYSTSSYDLRTLLELVGRADLIVVGEIVDVSEERYQIKIIQQVYGQFEGSIVELYQGKGCYLRSGKCEIGQSVMVFIDVRNDKSLQNMGEFRIFDKKVYVWAFLPDNSKYERSKNEELQYRGTPIDLDDVVSAIQGYHKCFKVEKILNYCIRPEHIQQMCDEKELNQYRQGSHIAEILIIQNEDNYPACGF